MKKVVVIAYLTKEDRERGQNSLEMRVAKNQADLWQAVRVLDSDLSAPRWLAYYREESTVLNRFESKLPLREALDYLEGESRNETANAFELLEAAA